METVKLLWDCARALQPESHTKKLLKSNYMTTCRIIASNVLQVPREKFSVTQMCPHCLQFWSENEYDLQLKPQQLARSSKAKRLIGKLEESLATNTKLLNGKQRKRAKWLKKKVTSKLKITCNFCKQTSEIALEKPNLKKRLAKETPTQKVQQIARSTTQAKKKGKSKTKDRTAGLKIVEPPTKAVHVNKTPTTMVKNTNNNNNKQQPNTKTTPSLSLPMKAKKKKNKNKATAQQATPVAPKIQSKTQQKNSLLQLATLLRNQAAKPKTPQNRLDALLK